MNGNLNPSRKSYYTSLHAQTPAGGDLSDVKKNLKEKASLLLRQTITLFHAIVVLSTVHDFLLFDAASTSWEDGETTCRDGNWDFLVTREGSGADHTAALKLSIDTRASIAFTLWSTTAARKTWRPRLTTDLAVEAAKSDLSRAGHEAGWVGQYGAVGTTYCAAQDELFFVNGVVSHV
mmetsp:Transcript_19171/g.24168  ORF Transcript_19171/g.24168 Transcript_19171/m.24168 type:complete len:178 (-) Transcript_19171:94-627(-)